VDPGVDKKTNNDSVYFTLRWSAALPLDRHAVTAKVPSCAGVFELYRESDGRGRTLIGRSRAYYGGLRNTLRGLIDPDTPYAFNGELLDFGKRHWVRYVMTESSEDMDDILFFFANREIPQPRQNHSGRYRFVYVKEESLASAS
jgi:hypothetical protein